MCVRLNRQHIMGNHSQYYRLMASSPTLTLPFPLNWDFRIKIDSAAKSCMSSRCDVCRRYTIRTTVSLYLCVVRHCMTRTRSPSIDRPSHVTTTTCVFVFCLARLDSAHHTFLPPSILPSTSNCIVSITMITEQWTATKQRAVFFFRTA